MKKDKEQDKKYNISSMWRQIREAYKMLRDPNTPRIYKALLIIVVVYILSPFDVIPDYVPFAGYLDDVGVFLLAIRQINIWVQKWHKTKRLWQEKQNDKIKSKTEVQHEQE